MKVLRHDQPGFSASLRPLQRHHAPDPQVEKTVREILAAVRTGGDAALLQLTEKFGGPRLAPGQLLVIGAPRADARTKEAIAAARANVRAFAEKSLRKTWSMKNAQGAEVSERFDPFQRVGIYVPGGSAPLISTAIMTVTLAKAAGCPEIVVTTPPGPDGKINEPLHYALEECGATEIYRVGGAQAIAALAYGTATIAPVRKIFGPGSAYVVEAKRQVFGHVAIDLLPGPSEILIIADATANPAWLAADLLAQAEHGPGSRAVFITNSAKLLASVEAEMAAQKETLPRRKEIDEALAGGGVAILVKSLMDAVDIANDFAPEHLLIAAKNEDRIAGAIHSAGAIFLGALSPVAAGDFLAGPSHTLPTGGAARSFAGLTVEQFQRRTSLVRYDEKALKKSIAHLEAFADAEGLAAHGRSARIRLG
jgi:histidinol dehydrogenase